MTPEQSDTVRNLLADIAIRLDAEDWVRHERHVVAAQRLEPLVVDNHTLAEGLFAATVDRQIVGNSHSPT